MLTGKAAAIVFLSCLGLFCLGVQAQAQDAGAGMPDAPGKAVLLSKCAICHDTSVIKSRRMSADDWRVQVQTMASQGAEVTPAEADQIVDYLATYYGLTPPPKK